MGLALYTVMGLALYMISWDTVNMIMGLALYMISVYDYGLSPLYDFG